MKAGRWPGRGGKKKIGLLSEKNPGVQPSYEKEGRKIREEKRVAEERNQTIKWGRVALASEETRFKKKLPLSPPATRKR